MNGAAFSQAENAQSKLTSKSDRFHMLQHAFSSIQEEGISEGGVEWTVRGAELFLECLKGVRNYFVYFEGGAELFCVF